MPRIPVFLLLFVVAHSRVIVAQNQAVSDASALALASQSIAILTGGNSITDVTLTGNSTTFEGGDSETGPATLYAKGTTESRVDLNLSGGLHSDIRNDTYGNPQGASVFDSGGQQSWPLHNCRINASWFFPALSVLAATSDPAVVLLYVGQELRKGATVQHLQSFRYAADKHPWVTALNQSLSTMDIYLDSTSLLPVAMTFNSHPDEDALTNFAIEVDFSSYQSFSGVQVPTHIQKFMDGGLALDLTVSNAGLNNNPSDELFAIQQ